MSSPIPKGEMPIVLKRLNSSDTDGSGTFNLEEFQKLSDGDILSSFKYGHKQFKNHYDRIDYALVSFDHAVDVFQQLKPKTRSYVLRALTIEDKIPGYQDYDLGNEFINRLAEKDLDQLVDDLARDYSNKDLSYGYHDENGLKGHLLLKDLEAELKDKLLTRLEEHYPKYAALIKSWDKPKANDTYGSLHDQGTGVADSPSNEIYLGIFGHDHPIWNPSVNLEPYKEPITPHESDMDKYSKYILGEQGFDKDQIGTEYTPLAATHHNVLDALKDALKGKDFKVFGFGETHIKVFDTPDATSFEYFASDMVPYLVKEQGVEVIGVELIYEEANDEIDYYMEHGEIDSVHTPILYDLSLAQEGDGTLTLLKNVRGLRQEGYDVELKGLNTEKRSVTSEIITIKSIRVANKALREGKKVALYNGSDHNEVDPAEELTHSPYIRGLAIPREQMFELDFVVPDYHTTFPGRDYSKDDEWYYRAPKSGVHLHEESKNRYDLAVAKNSGMGLLVNGVTEASPPSIIDSIDTIEAMFRAIMMGAYKKPMDYSEISSPYSSEIYSMDNCDMPELFETDEGLLEMYKYPDPGGSHEDEQLKIYDNGNFSIGIDLYFGEDGLYHNHSEEIVPGAKKEKKAE